MSFICMVFSSSARAVELLVDTGFEFTTEVDDPNGFWDWVFGNLPMPTVNATSDPLSGSEHAEIVLDTSQLFTQFGPTLRSSAFAGIGPSIGVTDFTGMTMNLTNHYKVTSFGMTSIDPNTPPAVLVRTYLAYFNDTVGFLGFGGFNPDPNGNFPSDVFPEGVDPNYQTTSYSVAVPNFGIAVTSVDFTFGLIAPDDNLGNQMTGTATVIFDDVSLDADVPLAGDFDMDGDVDGFDFLLWQRGSSLQGGTLAELAVWEANYGTQALVAAVTSVPEPTGALMFIGGAWFAVLRRRSGRWRDQAERRGV
jgi:hypothetical protein